MRMTRVVLLSSRGRDNILKEVKSAFGKGDDLFLAGMENEFFHVLDLTEKVVYYFKDGEAKIITV